MSKFGRFTFLLFLSAFVIHGQSSNKTIPGRMSGMGQLAQERIKSVGRASARPIQSGSGNCADGNLRCAPDTPVANLGGTQAETSIAVDSTGRHIVIGFNDFRGFSNSPVSLSGFMYSDDGGKTFKDGGQLPSPGDQVLFGEVFPQIYGDPDVKYLGGCNFVYASILLKVAGTGLVQTLGIHRSFDCGHTWTGPIEVTAATNPHLQVDPSGNAVDAGDKELMDVDPDTGRVLIGWANFTPFATGGVEISTTYSDNILSANPTFSRQSVVASGVDDGQGVSVRFAGGGSPAAYISWVRFPGFYTRRIGLARSTDNGVTWSAPMDVTPTFVGMDQVLGNDRVNENPTIAVDNSPGPYKGTVYIVYANNNSRDGSDVSLLRSTDGGVTFSAPLLVNSRPGGDRPQWFPFVSADKTTGRATIFYYDQGVDTSGHLTQLTYLFSDDGGATWSRPAQLSDRPFKAGWGNDTSQPNLGDYIQSVSQGGTFYAAYAFTRPQKFTDGQPSTQLIVPDVGFSKISMGDVRLPLRLGAVTFTESSGDGKLNPGDTAKFRFTIVNGDTNPLHAGAVLGVTATLSSTTPGVAITQAQSAYPNLSPGASGQNATEFMVSLTPALAAGTPIEFELNVTANNGTSKLLFTQPTGTPLGTVLLSEDFESAPVGALPAGWRSVHGAGANVVPWQNSSTFCGSSKKAFHPNADDGPGPGLNGRWERLLSPVLTIPTDADSVEVEFDACYDTEDDPVLPRTAYDGFFLRVTDLTPGRTVRSVLVEAFEEEFTTGPIKHYPKHFPRNSDPSYFEDMSAWAGDSGGSRHVRMKLPGMAGSTVQFRFEFTQDGFANCVDVRPGHACGVSVDNFVVRSVRNVAPATVNLTWQAQLSRDASNNIVATVTVTNGGTGTAQNVRLTSGILGTTPTNTTPLPVLGAIAPGASATAVIKFPPSAGAAGSASVLRLTGTYQGGNFGGSVRVTIP